jgi:hypothetical protein
MLYCCGAHREAKKPAGSADQKVTPSQTRHKNATEAGQFDREVAEAKQGGGAGPSLLIKGHTVRPP